MSYSTMTSAAPSTTNTSTGLHGLVAQLDKTRLMQRGENGHLEYGATSASDLQERLLQITFQSTRNNFVDRFNLQTKFAELVRDITLAIYTQQHNNEELSALIELWELCYRSIVHLRDIESGKGECRLAYAMLFGWHRGCFAASEIIKEKTGDSSESISEKFSEFIRGSSELLSRSFLVSDEESVHPFGSFKDFKYVCLEFALMHRALKTSATDVHNAINVTKRTGKAAKTHHHSKVPFRFTQEDMQFLRTHPMISFMANVFGVQLLNDLFRLTFSQRLGQDDSAKPVAISLAGKWAPRFDSDLFGPTAELIVDYLVPEAHTWRSTMTISNRRNVKELVSRKIKTTYRQRLSMLNKHLQTVQVKQCLGKWSEIDFDKDVTSVTLARQKKAFMGLNGKAENSEDRKACAENFAAFRERVKTGTSVAKGKRISMTDFVKDAMDVEVGTAEADLLDAQWNDNATKTDSLGDMIAMVDVSGSMTCDNNYPLNTAIGLGIRIAEKSKLGNRVMTFSANPTWVNLEDQPSFVERVRIVQSAEWGMNTNFHKALKRVLSAAIEAKLTADDVARLCLVILSDMQMDAAGSYDASLYEVIKAEFAEAGVRVGGMPWSVPKIVFWNLRTTEGYPSTKTSENAIMVSGGSEAVLNTLCEFGPDALESLTPFNGLREMLMKPRYTLDFDQLSTLLS